LSTEAAPPSGTGPRGRGDGSLDRAQDVFTGAVAATASNGFLALPLAFAVLLLSAAALAPQFPHRRLQHVIAWRPHVAAAGLACLTAWLIASGIAA
jgi:hypothetical protein